MEDHLMNEDFMNQDSTHKKTSFTYMGISVGSVLLSAGLTLLKRRMGLVGFLGVVAPAILLYGVSRRLAKLEAAHAAEKILH